MRPTERNASFSNKLIHSSSPYLRQHAHNPVFWYPWGREAIEQARAEQKPILLSIGYSTCYWCHVMEREVFENLSIASLMNRSFINIKVDREEHPHLDEIYMVARQLMTHEGGWPNNVFLTPDLKPFYAGGTFGPDDAYGKPSFPRLLEWLTYLWTTQREETRSTAHDILNAMRPHLLFNKQEDANAKPAPAQMYAMLRQYYDGRAGGFFQAPKFPHESYLQFLLGLYEYGDQQDALDMATHSLGKMAAGGIYDHVGCGFHRYAVDKEWYVPHFEKMLYNQAQLARVYTDAARLTGNAYFADIARSVLDFVSGPLTSGTGVFYSGIDAETDGVEGAYYAWSAQELESMLSPEEVQFFTRFYALADIPAFPGHKHVEGQALIARKPLDVAAQEHRVPYVQLAAMTAQIMNKLLVRRNLRQPPRLDDKIIVAWNGLMIDAFAHAGKVFGHASYIERAAKAAGVLLEHAIDRDGKLRRIYAHGRAQMEATLEDHAYLIKGLLTLGRVTSDTQWMDAAVSLISRVEEGFGDKQAPGYFFTEESEFTLIRTKNGDDSAMPNANAVMLHNFIDAFEIAGEAKYLSQAKSLADYFLQGNAKIMIEFATLSHAALRLEAIAQGKAQKIPVELNGSIANSQVIEEESLRVTARLSPGTAKPGDICDLLLDVHIKEGWRIQANIVNQPDLVPTQLDVQGDGVELLSVSSPPPSQKTQPEGAPLLVFEGFIPIVARLRLSPAQGARPAVRAMLRFQPCFGTSCYPVRDLVVTI